MARASDYSTADILNTYISAIYYISSAPDLPVGLKNNTSVGFINSFYVHLGIFDCTQVLTTWVFNLKFLFKMQVDFFWKNSKSLCLYIKGKHITQQMCLYASEGQIYELTVHEINLDDLCWSRPQDNLHIFHYLTLPSRLTTGLWWYQFLTCMID